MKNITIYLLETLGIKQNMEKRSYFGNKINRLLKYELTCFLIIGHIIVKDFILVSIGMVTTTVLLKQNITS